MNNGGYVVVWTSYGQDGSYDGVYMQRFGANGEKLGAEEQVAESTLNHQNQPSVDALEEGGFVVSWTGYNAESKTYDIFTQRYTNDGIKGYSPKELDRKDNANAIDSFQSGLVNVGGNVVSGVGKYLAGLGEANIENDGKDIVS